MAVVGDGRIKVTDVERLEDVCYGHEVIKHIDIIKNIHIITKPYKKKSENNKNKKEQSKHMNHF